MRNVERTENTQDLRDSLKELEIRLQDCSNALKKVNSNIEIRSCCDNQALCV